MISLTFNYKKTIRDLFNTAEYGLGFLDGIEMNRLEFNTVLAEYTEQALGRYVDAAARGNPDSLHHVYEWGQVGYKKGRLYQLQSKATTRTITISGEFIPSRVPAPGANVPFRNKAYIMENQITVIIEPDQAEVLAFQVDGETVFTPNQVVIEHPGGEQVENAFGEKVYEFFSVYYTSRVIPNLYKKLGVPKEYAKYYRQGVRSGRIVGVKAGKEYYSPGLDKIV